MSKKTFVGGIIGLVAILIGVGLLFFIKDDNEEPTKDGNEIIYISLEQDRKLNSEYKVLKSYSEYEELFKNDKVSKDKFKNNDYVLLEIMYDECSEDEIDVKNYSLNEKGLLTVSVEYKASCGVCAPQYMYYLLKVDKGAVINDVKVNSKAKNIKESQIKKTKTPKKRTATFRRSRTVLPSRLSLPPSPSPPTIS